MFYSTTRELSLLIEYIYFYVTMTLVILFLKGKLSPMKFSCEYEGIDYFFETTPGKPADAKYYFLLSAKEKKSLDEGEMRYYDLNIKATVDETTLEFVICGIPLHQEDQKQLENLEDFFENQCIFSKIEHMFSLEERDEDFPHWGKKL